MSLDWTKKEFEAYVLLYAAQCNLIETQEERDYILSKIDNETFNRIHNLIVFEKDEESLERIKEYLYLNQYKEEERRELIRDIKQVFFADGTVDKIEKNIFAKLTKILS